MTRTKTIPDERVVDLAVDLLVEAGPQGFTLAALGARAGLSAATLVQRFGNRAALLERAISRSSERLVAAVPAPAVATVASLVGWLGAQTRGMETRQRLAGHMALLMEDLRTSGGRRAALANAHVLEMRAGIAGQLQAMGFIDAEVAASTVEAHWHGLVIQWGLAGKGSLRAWVESGLLQVIAMLPRR
ncbi:TetR/AcrR family transcriptional regulator [Stenotrophomonas maltophilia]|uniref:TetR/AcrR family transcriptional regulator n=1 Tax=Stenotrophomonas maltophilia TaxID=40324 RepID=UPI0015DE1737|nr:TetR/AcrR family transcriptional regulator [Stenotrophomonas maltophilia]MBA0445882.1 TetR/AcrR family transcriptional regulator [Stenotrophomonas maltophilia]